MLRHSGLLQVYGINSSKQMRKDLAFFKTWLALFPLISKDHVGFHFQEGEAAHKGFPFRLLDTW